MTTSDLVVLLPELLLAAAQGKVPRLAAEEADARAIAALGLPGLHLEERVAIAAGLMAWRGENRRRRSDQSDPILLPPFGKE